MIRYTAARPNIVTGVEVAPPPGVRTDEHRPSRAGEVKDFNPKRSREYPHGLDLIFEILKSAAKAGAPCPTNEQLCVRAGIVSWGTVSSIVATLERRGLIRVTRWQSAREIEIVATGHRTAVTAAVRRGSQHQARKKW